MSVEELAVRPILGDLAELMDAIVEKWGDSTMRVLYRYPGGCEVEIATEHRHMSFSTMILPVEPAVVAEAEGRGWIEGKKEWGGRSRHEMVASESGKRRYFEAVQVSLFLHPPYCGNVFRKRFRDILRARRAS